MELIAPAGDWDCAKAAVENGADAVYFGLDAGFNARARAVNFATEQVPELMSYLRRRGVRGYVTLNTLVFPDELEALERTAGAVVAAGVDAAIVQDLGAARLIRAVCPLLPLHASTQMTLTSAECIGATESLGIERVVLPRELSIAEIAALRRQTSVSLEVFVHGALCISYSGQCLASKALGGRSANRGQCAQACRLPYEVVCDGRNVDLQGRQYPLSPLDLAAYDRLPELVAAGVDALKIEGRLKTAQYVANITRCYRLATDAATAGRRIELTPQQIEEMEICFSRGFSHGWLDGPNHRVLVPGLRSANRGTLLGTVSAVRGDRVLVALAGTVRRGDGVVFEADRVKDSEQGGRVFEVFQDGRSVVDSVCSGHVELTFGRGAIDLGEVQPGQEVWKTDDPQLARRLRRTYTSGRPGRRVPLDLTVDAAVGRPLRIVGRAASGATCLLETPQPLPVAVKHPLTDLVLTQQLGRLGNTPYELRRLEARIEGSPMVPLSVLGRLRQEMVRQLDASLALPSPRPLAAESVLPALRSSIASQRAVASTGHDHGSPGPSHAGQATGADSARLHVLCRTPGQLEAALACGATSLVADFVQIGRCADAVRTARAGGASIWLATPRIQKPGEDKAFSVLSQCGADGILVRNLGGLRFFRRRETPLVADFSLNAANEMAVDWLRQQGVGRVTACCDLGRRQLLDLAAAVPPTWLEVVVHQHIPMFHTEHCVFCATLSSGSDSGNCRRPCDRHAVRLRDRLGMEHPLAADAGCRNTVFHAGPQSAAEIVPLLLDRGIRDFRIELLDESDTGGVGRIVTVYRDLVAGRTTGREAWGRLRRDSKAGLVRIPLDARHNADTIA